MDLDVMADVQENIIGNCLCVLGDSMAMPVRSMVRLFRTEFEEHMNAARLQADERVARGTRSPISVSDEAGLAVPTKSEAA
jgi:NADH-quinone oxidoreductase subunit F